MQKVRETIRGHPRMALPKKSLRPAFFPGVAGKLQGAEASLRALSFWGRPT